MPEYATPAFPIPPIAATAADMIPATQSQNESPSFLRKNESTRITRSAVPIKMVNDNVFGLGGGERKPDGVFDAAGFVVRARPFFFPTGSAPTGFWLSPFFQLGYVRGLPADDGASFGGYAQSAGMSIGGTIPLGSRVMLALGGGAQLHAALFNGNTNPPGFSSVGPHVDINVDVRF